MTRVPRIVGIVNVTEDSFSDGGQYVDPAAAVAHARALVAAGADVIEIGPASSHPSATVVPATTEIARVASVLPAIQALGIPIALDSFHPETQRYALAKGVQYLNDTRGFPDAAMYEALAASSARLVVMHSILRHGRGTRDAQSARSVIDAVHAFFGERLAALESAGIDRSRLVIDPGMGFFLGGNPEPSLLMLRDVSQLKTAFAVPVMVSVSRKSFLGAVTGRDVSERGAATLAAELYCAREGVDYIRTHDVQSLNDGLKVLTAVAAAR